MRPLAKSYQPPKSPILGGILKRIGDTPKTPVLPRKDTSLFIFREGRQLATVILSEAKNLDEILLSSF
jgi:hypothetical protein